MRITYYLHTGEYDDTEEIILPEKGKTQTAKFIKKDKPVTLTKIKVSASNVAKDIEVELSITSKLGCNCSDGGICKVGDGARTVKIEHGETVLGNKFTLTELPYEIKVTVTDNCGDMDCKQITCTATVTIEIAKETEKEKEAREKKEKETEEGSTPKQIKDKNEIQKMSSRDN